MAEPFKNVFDRDLISMIGGHFAARDPVFDREGFEAMAGDGLEALEFKARSRRITSALEVHLPSDFARARRLIFDSLHPDVEAPIGGASDARGLRGWALMPVADFVAARGIGDFDASMDLLAEMTCRFTSEFAVRPFILANQPRAMAHVGRWALHANPHVRRLASEGSRPRLPWGVRLAPFVEDPSPLLPLLGTLRDDPSEYVRRSVANSLNDISKDHPDLMAEIAQDWLRGASPERSRLVRHACRTLVKRGHAGALAALGFGAAVIILDRITLATPQVTLGGALVFEVTLRSGEKRERSIALDYAIHHRKADGGRTPKVFKWKVLRLGAGETVRLSRKHPMRSVTTRVYRNGGHRVEVVANGVVLGGADFELVGA
jgi:3-methyladenine DNA glycosylase AlkC